MAFIRANLDDHPSNSLYLVLGILLIALSVLSWVLFTRLGLNLAASPKPSPAPVPTAKVNPTSVPEAPISPVPTFDPGLQPEKVPVTPTLKPAKTPLPTTAPKATPTPPGPTPVTLTLDGSADGFTVDYPSSRRLYTSPEAGGHRYTLYSSAGNIAVHAGTSWSWAHPQRQFSSEFTVAGQPAFVYEIDSQKIVDFQSGGRDYTIQCVHNGSDSIKAECDAILSGFKLL